MPDLRVLRPPVAPSHHHDESRLVARSRGGDPDAFAEFYARYRAVVLRLCLRKLRDPHLAEDATQDTFILARAGIEGFTSRQNPLPWLLTIAENRCADIRRYDRRRPSDLVDPGDEVWLRRRVESPLHSVLASEHRRTVGRALTTLPSRQRRALLLHAEGWDYTDIASAEQTSLPSIKSAIFRARRNLKRTVALGPLSAIWLPLGAWRRIRRTILTTHRATVTTVAASNLPAGVLALVLGLAPVPPVLSPHVRPGPAVTQAAHNAPAGHSGARQSHPRTGSLTPAGLLGTARDATDPNADVRQPEDTTVEHVTFASSGRSGFAVGQKQCQTTCPPVLFRTDDAGASWRRVGAQGFLGHALLLPPDFGAEEQRIFSMGPIGLQVSRDGGETFEAALPTAQLLLGSAAMSPDFNKGDARILVGAQVMMQYDDAMRVFEPSAYTALPGPLEPAFSPAFGRDGVLLVGGTRMDPILGRTGIVFRCTTNVCSETSAAGATPKIRISPDFTATSEAFAFDPTHLLRTRDQGRSFAAITTPWSSGLRDVFPGGMGKPSFAAARGATARDRGLFVSPDRGASWHRVPSALFETGALTVTARGNHVLVGTLRGVACSEDGGETWRRRCSPPSEIG